MVRRVEDTKNTKGQLNVYEQFRILVGMINRGGAFIDRATQTVKLENRGKSLKQVLEPLKFEKNKKLNEQGIKKQYAELNAYLIGDHKWDMGICGYKGVSKIVHIKKIK